MAKNSKAKWILLSSSVLSLVGCGSGRPNYSPATTPPEVAFSPPPPAYTVTPSITIGVTATDLQGVGKVYVLVGAERVAASRQADGTWQATILLPVVGHNIVTVWAEDKATPTPNSGEGLDPPYQITADVDYAPTPPSLSYDASFASYADERTVELAVDGNGIAKVPPEYLVGQKLSIPPGGDIYKSSSRLSGVAMTVAELETTNGANIPVLRFTVPHNPNVDPPLESPTYGAHVTCTGCPDFPDSTGTLLAAAATDTQRALFDLPLSTETVPALAEVGGPATISLTITVTDAAGNETTVPGFNFTFHVIGPPVAWTEDTQYPAQAKPESTYAYHLADNTYATLWTAAPQFIGTVVRLVRYIITNPTPEPVALQLGYTQDPGGSWRAVETWNYFDVVEPAGWQSDGTLQLMTPTSAQPFSLDGYTYYNPMYWVLPFGGTSQSQAWVQYGPHPCGSDAGGDIVHRLGDSQNRFLCGASFSPPVSFATYQLSTEQTGVTSSGDVSTRLYRVAQELGGQERSPDTDPTGQWTLVPAASSGTPGTLVVYLVRSVTAARTRSLQWDAAYSSAVAGRDDPNPPNHYQTWDFELWAAWGLNSPIPGYEAFVAYCAGMYLSAAHDSLYGTLSGTTRPYGNNGVFGEALPRVSVALERDPLTTH